MSISDKLIEWLIKEIEQRGWSQRELARRANLAPTTVSEVIAGRTRPGLEFCKGIGKALDVPAADVLRLAGLLPPITEDIRLNEECLYNFNLLSVEHRRLVIIILRALAKAYGTAKAPSPRPGGVSPGNPQKGPQ